MVDAILLEEVLQHLHNWFERDAQVVSVSGCEIARPEQATEGGEATQAPAALPQTVSDMLQEGQWYRIEGSWLNDGLHLHPATDLVPETFDGTITIMRIPRPLLRVVEDIAEWQEKYGAASEGPYQSESFGGYSYTIRGSAAAQDGSGGLTGWRLAFRDRLNAWRRIA